MSANLTQPFAAPRTHPASHRIEPAMEEPARPVNVGAAERALSLVGGTALLAYGLRRGSWSGFGWASLGAMLAYRGWSGHCQVYQALGISTRDGKQAETVVRNGIQVRFSATIDRSATELYRIWRDFESLPRYMQHLASVTVMNDRRSHWVAKGPRNKPIEWDAEIITDREGKIIAWKSLPDADVDSAGSVRFEPAPGARGTEVRVQFNYAPPAGRAGAALAWFFGKAGQQQVEDDLYRFKAFMESGTIPTSEGQPHGPA